MYQSLLLRPRAYSVIDGLVLSFRCAPVAAFFYAFFDLASAVITPLATLAAARFIDAAIRSYHVGAPVAELSVWMGVLVGLTAFVWLRRAMHNLADLRLAIALRERYRTALTEKRTRLAYRHVEDADTWDLVQRVAANPEGGRLKESYFHLIDLASFVIKVGGLLAILASAVWWGPIPVLLVSGVALVAGIRGGRRLYDAEREVSRHDRRTHYLSGLLFGREAAAERLLFGFTSAAIAMWENAFGQALSVRIRARIRWYLNAYAGNVANMLVWLFLMVVLLKPLREGALTVGLFIALTQAFTRFDIVWGFMDTVNGVAADVEFYRDLTRFLSLEEAPPPRSRTTHGPVSVEAEDVRFAYPGTDRCVLDGLSFSLEAGRHYALVGSNGCGKTTITRLLTGLYAPAAGSIRVGGRDVCEWSLEELCSVFSIVYQDFARYGVTVEQNVFLGTDPGARARDVYREAGLDEIITRLPEGAATRLGKHVPGGIDLSGGEWQRIAIARSLAHPGPVRILDEPAASLDPLEESALYRQFDRLAKGATTLLITHRLGATRAADCIFVLDQGRIVESGTHAQLIRADRLYRRMYDSQRIWYEARS